MLVAATVSIKPSYQPTSENIVVEAVVDDVSNGVVVSFNGELIELELDESISADLQRGSRIVINGRYSDDAWLAEDVDVKVQDQSVFYGAVTAIDAELNQFVLLDNTFQVDHSPSLQPTYFQ